MNLRDALNSPNMRAFLHVIRVGEGTADPDGYRRMFGGELFESFADHPRKAITKTLGGRRITSTAAGAYQHLKGTWDECKEALDLPDFSPASQDLAAVFLINRRRALADVLAGRIKEAIEKCNREWASLPGSPYGQPTKTMQQAIATYQEAGGVFTEVPLAPFVAAAIPALVQAVPSLIRIFGDSPQSEKNAKAAEMVASIATAATGTPNVQAAVEAVQTPEGKKAFEEAVQASWFELVEVGGGVQAAREADLQMSGGDIRKSPSFWIALLLLPLVYLVVGSVVGLFGTAWSDDVRSAIAGTVVGTIIGAVTGYYFGQTTSRNRK